MLENQRALLRQVHPKARQHLQQRRADLPLAVHGQVHGGLEHGQQAVRLQNTAGEPEGFWNHVLSWDV